MERHTTNKLLRGEGYVWKKYEHDEEDQDMLGTSAFEWTLYSPDGRVVSVAEAMQELAYVGKAFAKEWLAEHDTPEQTPKIEVERQQKALKNETQRAEQTEKEKYIEDLFHEILRNGFSQEQARSEAARLSQPHRPFKDDVHITDPVQLDEDDSLFITLGSDIRYSVMIGDMWRGIDYMLRLHDALVEQHDLLLKLSQRNCELHP